MYIFLNGLKHKRWPGSAAAIRCRFDFIKCSNWAHTRQSYPSKSPVVLERTYGQRRDQLCYFISFQVAWTLITEFCADSSVHGVRYFTEKERHWSERCGIDMFRLCSCILTSMLIKIHTFIVCHFPWLPLMAFVGFGGLEHSYWR